MRKIASEAISKCSCNVSNLPLPDVPVRFAGQEMKDVQVVSGALRGSALRGFLTRSRWLGSLGSAVRNRRRRPLQLFRTSLVLGFRLGARERSARACARCVDLGSAAAAPERLTVRPVGGASGRQLVQHSGQLLALKRLQLGRRGSGPGLQSRARAGAEAMEAEPVPPPLGVWTAGPPPPPTRMATSGGGLTLPLVAALLALLEDSRGVGALWDPVGSGSAICSGCSAPKRRPDRSV